MNFLVLVMLTFVKDIYKLSQKSKFTSVGSCRKSKSLQILLKYGIGQLNW